MASGRLPSSCRSTCCLKNAPQTPARPAGCLSSSPRRIVTACPRAIPRSAGSDGDRTGRQFLALGTAAVCLGCFGGGVPPAARVHYLSDSGGRGRCWWWLRPWALGWKPGMRILFGVQGTGTGHISRSPTLARALKSRGVAVDYLFSVRAADGYSRWGVRGLSHLPGITFASHQGRISGWHPKGLSPRFWQDPVCPRIVRVRPGHQSDFGAAQCPCCLPLG